MLRLLGQKKVWKEAVNSFDRVYRLISSKEIVADNNGALDKVYNETVKAVTEQNRISQNLTQQLPNFMGLCQCG